MKRILAILIFLSSSFAFASSAQDVFDEVNYFLVINYGGFSSANVRGFADKYQPEITKACMDRVNTCPAEAAYPIVETMLKELNDGHTYFIPGGAARLKAFFAGTSGEKSFGVGLVIMPNQVGAFVDDVAKDSVGELAGIKRGDWLLGINGQALARDPENIGKLWFEAQESADTASLVISRQGKTLTIRVTSSRSIPANLPSVSVREDGVAVLRIPTFAIMSKVGLGIHEQVLEAQKQGAKAMIIDLRGNGGGFPVDEMAGVSAFINDGLEHRLITRNPLGNFYAKYEKGSISQTINGKPRVTYTVPNPVKWTLPVAVLVNGSSASASEYFAMDFQDAKRGAVIGEQTAGVANTATTIAYISDGSVLAVTVAKSVRPDGSAVPEHVTPDILVKDDLVYLNKTGHDAVLEKALEILK